MAQKIFSTTVKDSLVQVQNGVGPSEKKLKVTSTSMKTKQKTKMLTSFTQKYTLTQRCRSRFVYQKASIGIWHTSSGGTEFDLDGMEYGPVKYECFGERQS